LYSNKDSTEAIKFLNNTAIPVLAESSRACEGLLISREIVDTLTSMKENKSPGNDGLTVEFYKAYWPLYAGTQWTKFNCVLLVKWSVLSNCTAGSGGLFGQTAATAPFGQTRTTPTAGLFGAGGFDANVPTGTTIKFNPPMVTDIMQKRGVSSNINTRHQCITAMKEYESKCLEELRLEHYGANRKSFFLVKESGLLGAGGSRTQTDTSKGLFGATAIGTTGGFVGQNKTFPAGLFATPSTSTPSGAGFGANFGGTAGTGGIFCQTAATAPFGPTGTTPTAGRFVVGGFGVNVPTDTTIKFNPPTGTDIMQKRGVSSNIGTRHQCITAMKEYESKCLEELRLEDYGANRKGPGTGAGLLGAGGSITQTDTSKGLFGATATGTTGGLFGQNKTFPLGTTGDGQTTSGSFFGQTAQPQQTSLFASKAGGFGASTGSSLFTGTTGFEQTQKKNRIFAGNMTNEIDLTQLKKKRTNARSQLNRVLNKLEALITQYDTQSDKADAYEEIKSLRPVAVRRLEVLIAVDAEMISQLTEDDHEFQDTDDYEIAASARVNKAVSFIEKHSAANKRRIAREHTLTPYLQASGDIQSLTTKLKSMQLSKLEIPMFYGDALQWSQFDDKFVSTVDNNEHLSKVQKTRISTKFPKRRSQTSTPNALQQPKPTTHSPINY
uniref:Uncharacterized protein LOC102807145 n=1 Tax=Saccoglossus kowalevskii TaxID=10224 RepID=A0ABM0MFK1_SACKO